MLCISNLVIQNYNSHCCMTAIPYPAQCGPNSLNLNALDYLLHLGQMLESYNKLQTIANKKLSCCRDRMTDVWVSFGQCNWETIFCRHYRFIFNHCDVIGLQRYIEFDKITQNSGYYALQGHSMSPMSLSIPIKSPYATSY